MNKIDFDGCGELVQLILILVVLVVMLGAVLFGPCELYGIVRVTSVPARCISYFTGK